MIRRRYLGDTVLLEPFVRNLRVHWPRAWIAVALDSPYVEVLAGSRDLDEIIEIPVGRHRAELRRARWLRLGRRVGAHPYDVAFDLAHNETSQAIMMLSRAPRRIGLQLRPSRLRRGGLYTDIRCVDADEVRRTHAVDLNNSLLDLVGVPARARVPALEVSRDARSGAAAIIQQLWNEVGRPGGPTLLIHPGSGAPARRWPAAHFAYVADVAARRLEAHVIVLDGPSDGALAEEVRARMAERASLVRVPVSIPLVFGLLTQVDLLLCNDSGPMHMAAAVGTPVCAVYGAQSRATWGPLGSPMHRTFQADVPCGRACIAPDDCHPNDPMRSFCVRRVPREMVVAAAYAQLKTRTPRRVAPRDRPQGHLEPRPTADAGGPIPGGRS